MCWPFDGSDAFGGASGKPNADGTDSTLTITTSNPAATPESKAAEYGLPPAKPGNIDLTDEALTAARKSARLRAAMGMGRASTFLTGPAGDTGPMKLGMPTVLGG